MPDLKKHSDIIELLTQSQNAEEDNRQAAREATLFIHKRDGQWEPYWWDANRDQPRYTFDQVSPVVDQIAGEIERAEFAIDVKPAGGDATKDDAKLRVGMIRNIENISGAVDIYNLAARRMVTSGLNGWEIKQKFVDDNSFDQDLVIEDVPNFIDSVWFGPFTKPDASDMQYGWRLKAMPRAEYEKRFPEGSGQSISQNKYANAYYHKRDQVVVGRFYYLDKVSRELVKMSNGATYEDNEQFQAVRDELALAGVVEVGRRKVKKNVCKSRLFDGSDWLTEPQDTVFNQVPLVPAFANFEVFEDKLVYYGAVEKLIDPQRVYNYAKSREIAEGALAPRKKYWMTTKQAKGFEDTLRTLNTNADPVQFYNHDGSVPGPPQQSGGAEVNPGLQVLSNDMRGVITQAAGLFAANRGQEVGAGQSGVAIEKLQNKGDNGTIKYFSAMERAISRTCKIICDAMNAVYSTERMARIMNEDGSFEMVMLNQAIFDQQSGRMVRLNDLTKGKYDITCSAGPSFQNKQQETVTAITELGAIDPTLIGMSGDILFNNIDAPGMELIAQRKRRQLFEQGVIPFDQMTEEEKQETNAAQQAAAENPPQPDPAVILAQAEVGKAEAQTARVVAQAQAEQRKQDREDLKVQAQLAKSDFDQFIQLQKMTMEQNAALVDELKKQAETLKLLREAMGVDAAVGPAAVQAYSQQARNMTQITQEV